MNPEWLRYYIAAKLNAQVEDIDFNPDDFVARVNSDLVGKYVNIASRAAGFIAKRFDGTRCDAAAATSDDSCLAAARRRAGNRRPCTNEREYGKALREIMALADIVNDYVDRTSPGNWPRRPAQERCACTTSAAVCIEAFRLLTIYLKPVLPASRRRSKPSCNVEPLQWRRCASRRWRGPSSGRCVSST